MHRGCCWLLCSLYTRELFTCAGFRSVVTAGRLRKDFVINPIGVNKLTNSSPGSAAAIRPRSDRSPLSVSPRMASPSSISPVVLATIALCACCAGATNATRSCGSAWAEVASAAFPARSDHVAVWWRERLWVSGGGNYAASYLVYPDTWATDASLARWQLISASSSWAPRAYHAAGIVDDAWVITGGGFCDGNFTSPLCAHYGWFGEVWATRDGVSWSLLASSGVSPGDRSADRRGGSGDVLAVTSVCAAPVLNRTGEVMFCPRGGHTLNVVTMGGTSALVLTGGMNNTDAFNDVWGSADGGTTWALVAAPAPWSPRAFHAAASVGAVLYVSGGAGGGGPIRRDVWASPDGGATWAELTSAAAWRPRFAHSLTAVGGGGALLLVAGQLGLEDVLDSGSADVWASRGGDAWTLTTANTTWPIRSYHAATLVPGSNASAPARVAVTGGWRLFTQDAPPGYAYKYYSDVWATEWDADC